MMTLTLDILKRLWPHGDQHVAGLCGAIASSAPEIASKYGIDSDLAWAHFMAQASEECGAGLELVENLDYSASGLIATWPTRFGPTRARKYAGNPRMIADAVYGGRMGNAAPPSNDGWDFRGRGLTQLTGREDYAKVDALLHIDIVDDPDLVLSLANVLEVGAVDFCKLCIDGHGKSCLDYAKEDNVLEVTRLLNGGTIGLTDRKQWLARWKTALGVS